MTTPSATRRLAAGLAAALALAAGACKSDTLNTACQNERYNIQRPTDGPMLAYGINVKSIQYHYLATRPDTMEMNWDTSSIYFGWACLRFHTTDSVRIDSSGAFQLVMDGSNSSLMRRRIVSQGPTVNDSVIGYVFRGCDGDGGTYRLMPDSTVSFTWRNGQQAGIFSSAARHQLSGDTIRTSLDVGTPADTVHGYWRIKWGRTSCGEGF